MPTRRARLFEQGESRKRAREVAARIRQRPSLRTHMEDVLRTLREALPEARGSFLTSSEGLPLAVSRSDGGKDVDALSAMVCGSVLKNLDMVGGNLELEGQESGLVRFHKGARGVGSSSCGVRDEKATCAGTLTSGCSSLRPVSATTTPTRKSAAAAPIAMRRSNGIVAGLAYWTMPNPTPARARIAPKATRA